MEQLSPNRMTLLTLRARLGVSENGLALIRSKREALMREFFLVVNQAVEARDLLQNSMREAVTDLSLALGMDGRALVESAAFAARRDLTIELVERNVWGVRFPDIEYRSVLRSSDARGYALSGVSSYINNGARKFEKVLDIILKMVSVETRLKRIGNEIRKTTRRINALTEVILPALKRRIRRIRFSLEEREREEIFRMKRFKKKALTKH